MRLMRAFTPLFRIMGLGLSISILSIILYIGNGGNPIEDMFGDEPLKSKSEVIADAAKEVANAAEDNIYVQSGKEAVQRILAHIHHALDQSQQ